MQETKSKIQDSRFKIQDVRGLTLHAVSRGKRSCFLFLASRFLPLASYLLLLCSSVQAEEKNSIQSINRLAIFPLENVSRNLNAPSIIKSLLEKELQNKGFQIIQFEHIDKFLGKRRIRHTGSIDKITAIEIGKELNVDAVLIGSIDIYSVTNDEMYAGLTLRLVGTKNCSIIWMDTLSYAGSDFAGLLGFGKLKSLERLGEIIVTKMTREIPKEYSYEVREEESFEVGGVRLDPVVTMEGKPVKLSARIISIKEKPVTVSAILDGITFDLMNGNGDYYDGEIIAPVKDGEYPLNIIIKGSSGEIYNFFSVGVVGVDTVPPKVTIFSNKNVTAGFIKKDGIIFTLNSDEATEKWEVDIVDAENKYVRNGKGFGTLPRQLIWKGENDLGGKNNDGVYMFKLSVWDTAGNVGVFQKEIKLDTTPPAVKIDAESATANEVVFNFDYGEDEIMDKWEFVVVSEKSKLVKKLNGNGNIDKKIKMSFEEGEGKEGSIIYTFRAVDIAGNTFETSNQTLKFAERKGEKFTKKIDETLGWGGGDF